jgi:crotonobetainyl-CoA:carnitine CoA-transferase CaiB-like acyl-CoA transferase
VTAPLRGLRVVELETGLAGSIAGKLLADHGAAVFTRSASESQPSDAPVWDRAKTVLSTDEELESEALGCDVLIIGPVEVGDAPPSMVTGEGTITCTITGYGRTGPLAGRPAEDSLVAARLGLAANQPGWSEGPSFIAHPIPSFGAALLASQGICAALMFREVTGRAIDVETSLVGGTIAMSSRVAGRAIPKGRTWYWKANGPLPFYSSYECSDGAWLQLGCIHDGFVQRAIEALGIEDPIIHEKPGRPKAPADLDRVEKQYRLLAEAMATRPRQDWLAILERADVPCAPVNSSADYLSDPQARHNAGGLPLGDDVPSIRIHADSEDPPLVASERTGGGTGVDSPAFGHGRAEAAAPLRGLRVLEIGNLIAGPMTSRLLADLGAEVIKLEPPGIGDITRQNGSPAFYPLNSGKRGIAVDLRSDAGREIGQTLAANADILIDNMRPGVAERLGLGWDQLRKRHRQLIYCHVSAFGSTGPYAHRPGLDPLAGALSGLQLEQGGREDRPVYLQGALVDHTAAMLAAYGVLVALFARSRTGRGGRVETSLLDAAALLNAPAYAASGPRSGERSQFGPKALNRLYRTADGWLALAVRADAAAKQLRALLDEDGEGVEWSGSASVSAGADRPLAARLETLFAKRTADWWLGELASRGVPAERVASGEDHAVLVEPHLVEAGMVIDQEYRELGMLRITHGWWQLGGGATGTPPGPAPELGEHTVEILEELGYSSRDIEEWMTAGVVAGGVVG